MLNLSSRRIQNSFLFLSSIRFMSNRLINEKSPYLLQHKDNPVDWWPWCNEIFEKAKKDNKLIFLSIGYSTCHWCHVMEHECFENKDIANQMNNLYYNIKVDREERPDIDKTYMSFVQQLGVGSGWPLSIWLTPNKTPIWGGTYFPPKDAYGRPSFPTVLNEIFNLYKTKQDELENQGLSIIKRIISNMDVIQSGIIDKEQDIHELCYKKISTNYDVIYGGFTKAPKFPTPPVINFMFRYSYLYHSTDNGKNARIMALHTLKSIGNGGIYDHIGGGFHRYSVDKYWHIPHYEKMIYDQAQLINCFLEAYQISNDNVYYNTVLHTLEYIITNLRDEKGGIYSAEDADSITNTGQLKEGYYYIWTYDELKSLIGNNEYEFNIFCLYYGIEQHGNTPIESDPHNELIGTNTLIIRNNINDFCLKNNISIEKCLDIITKYKQILYNHRNKRNKPRLDDKIITSWNGLILSSFSKAYNIIGDSLYLQYAENIANFIKTYLFKDNMLLRSYRNGPSSIYAFTNDYCFLIKGLLDLYEACGNIKWLKWAIELQEIQNNLFWDNINNGYWNTTKQYEILFQTKEIYDGAEPSDNSISLQNLLRLSKYNSNIKWDTFAEKLKSSFHQYINRVPQICPEIIPYINETIYDKQYIIVGDIESYKIKEYLRLIHSKYDPFKIIIHINNEDSKEYFKSIYPIINNISLNEEIIYICENQTCQLPFKNINDLKDYLFK